jgi:thiamine biosynthesis lipoprotein
MIKKTVIMAMPITVCIEEKDVKSKDIKEVFDYLKRIDNKFSIFKKHSEISKINRGEVLKKDYSPLMRKIISLCLLTKKQTNGYFDIEINGKIDPSGIIKGYAINEAAKMLLNKGYKNFFVEIAGDAQTHGTKNGQSWKIGIQNPFNKKEIVKTVGLINKGIATSGNYIKGKHIFNPKTNEFADDIASITVIASNVYEADRFATAAFAMGEKGIEFIASQKGLEGYMIKKDRTAVFTPGFEKYVETN